jgi:hypothetical protein
VNAGKFAITSGRRQLEGGDGRPLGILSCIAGPLRWLDHWEEPEREIAVLGFEVCGSLLKNLFNLSFRGT